MLWPQKMVLGKQVHQQRYFVNVYSAHDFSSRFSNAEVHLARPSISTLVAVVVLVKLRGQQTGFTRKIYHPSRLHFYVSCPTMEFSNHERCDAKMHKTKGQTKTQWKLCLLFSSMSERSELYSFSLIRCAHSFLSWQNIFFIRDFERDIDPFLDCK